MARLTISGLETLTYTMTDAGAAFIDGKIQLPTVTAGGGQSSVVTTIKQNGSTIQTTTEGADGFHVHFLAAVGDVMTIQLSSSAVADQPLNTVKAVVGIGLGV